MSAALAMTLPRPAEPRAAAPASSPKPPAPATPPAATPALAPLGAAMAPRTAAPAVPAAAGAPADGAGGDSCGADLPADVACAPAVAAPAPPPPAAEARAAAAAAAAAAGQRAPRRAAPPRPRPLTSASFLTAGQTFCGSQTVNVSSRKESDNWRVNCCIQGVDLRRGTVCGSMEALDVPKAASPVVTFWEGEIVDNANHFFFTRRWGAHVQTDLAHWSKFRPFAALHDRVERDGGDDIDLSNHRFVFMRWKEQFFVNCDAEDCGLTIQGFYYLCLDTQTGGCLAYYFDPRSEPFQRLQLTALCRSNGGYCSPSYSFA